MKNDDYRESAGQLLDADEVQGVLSGAFYTAPPSESARGRVPRTGKAAAKPEHYKVICISLYNSDLEQLDAMVEKLKARGLTKANRSALIRYALEQVDLEKVPKGIGLVAQRRVHASELQNAARSAGSGASMVTRSPVMG